MITFQLQVFLGMYDEAVEKAVCETAVPESVQTKFFSFAENKNDIPENVTAVFITDKISLLRSAAALHKKNLRIVYCGTTSDAGRYLNKLEALWPAGESANIVKKRFLILVKNLKNEFDAGFYQNTLHSLIENMPFPTAVFSPDWEVVKMNHAFEEISKNFDYQTWKEKVLTPVDTQKFQIEVNGKLKYFTLKEQEIHDCFDNISGYFLMMQEMI